MRERQDTGKPAQGRVGIGKERRSVDEKAMVEEEGGEWLSRE